MNILVTGGAGFIGRWVVKKLLDDGHNIWVLDNLVNGRIENIKEFVSNKHFKKFINGDINDKELLADLFNQKFDICFHLAASINVQDSIDDPETTFRNDVIGTFNILEECKKHNVKVVFMSTCMVYDSNTNDKGIKETDRVKPASPYAGSKLAAENMVMSYYYAYNLPTVIIRPFNTYGPYQKTSGEGGVIAIFLKNLLAGKPIHVYGDGNQTRDFLYVEDCADFIIATGYSNKVNGEIIHAGLGKDISINDLANYIMDDSSKIQHVTHIHPQSEIPKLLCDYSKAKQLLGWEPKTSLLEGIERTKLWIQTTRLS